MKWILVFGSSLLIHLLYMKKKILQQFESPLKIIREDEYEYGEAGYGEAEAEDDQEEQKDPNKILDELDLPNYNDVEMRLAEPEMTATLKRNYLQKVIKDADRRRRQVIAFKSDATKKFNKGQITAEQRNLAHEKSDGLRKEINAYIDHYKFKSKSIKGYGLRRGQRGRQLGRGAYFFNDAKEMLQKLTLIIAEMEAGNTSIDMRNMGQTILDALLRSKHLNKQQYGQLVKKFFKGL